MVLLDDIRDLSDNAYFRKWIRTYLLKEGVIVCKKKKDAVNMTIDLFSRIKNTDHAEMVATVLYAYDCLHAKKDNVSDAEVFRFVMDWKPKWIPDKQDVVCDTILNLTMLNWMQVTHSSELQYSDN